MVFVWIKFNWCWLGLFAETTIGEAGMQTKPRLAMS